MRSPSEIGPYKVEREIGRGGMGVVYLGRDPRLGREVAIKMLPEQFSRDPKRVQRFEREARLLASLSHPNIAGIYGLEEQEGRRYLVLEHVPGETLAERIARGPLTVDDAAEVCRQIAAAVEAAHESGIIHRDLKPGNVKIAPAGEVKVLDFGLAKGPAASSSVSASDLSQSPTMTEGATGSGVILGTAAYMSPEQARGKLLDRRTDIWSFGCVLYECLTGRRVFEGETASDLIALILQGPPDWEALPENTPPRVRALLERCLEKDAKKRLRDIGEARLALDAPYEPISGASWSAATAVPATKQRRIAWWALTGVLAATSAVLGGLLLSRPGDKPEVARLSVMPPAGLDLSEDPMNASLSPDGRTLAFVCSQPNQPRSLWIRSLDDATPHRLEGTDGAVTSTWSPDGRSIAFTTQDKLMRLDLRGGAPQLIAGVTAGGRGASWGSRGTIVFAPGGQGPLSAVDAGGGPIQQVTDLDSSETAHRFPDFLPDGIHFIYTTLPGRGQELDSYIGSTEDATRERLIRCDGAPRYAAPGWLVYTNGGRVLARRFDPARRKLDGPVMALVDEPRGTSYIGSPSLLVSHRGPLAYPAGNLGNTEMVLLDRSGQRIRTIPVPEGRYRMLAVSPDGTQLAAVQTTSAETDLWVFQLERRGARRLTSGANAPYYPIWSPDGAQLAYTMDIQGRREIVLQSVISGESQILKSPGSNFKFITSWSPDGRYLLGYTLSEKTGWDVWVFPVDGDPAERYVGTPFDEQNARFSPDGKWVSYASNESGREEVYVQSFPSPGRRYQVSPNGATDAWWSRDGRHLMLRVEQGATIMDLRFDNGVQTEHPVGLFSTPLTEDVQHLVAGAISPDFERVYASIETHSTDLHPYTVVLNWRSALEPE
jgi:Tol biopolymer transport system component/predicted Ser/Thr protein kinase